MHFGVGFFAGHKYIVMHMWNNWQQKLAEYSSKFLKNNVFFPNIMSNLPDQPEYDEISNIKHYKSLCHPNSDNIASDEGCKSQMRHDPY